MKMPDLADRLPAELPRTLSVVRDLSVERDLGFRFQHLQEEFIRKALADTQSP